LIDVQKGQLILRVQEEQVIFNVFKTMKYPAESDTFLRMDLAEKCTKEVFHSSYPTEPLAACLMGVSDDENSKIMQCVHQLEATPPIFIKKPFENLGSTTTRPIPSINKPPVLELKTLPSHL